MGKFCVNYYTWRWNLCAPNGQNYPTSTHIHTHRGFIYCVLLKEGTFTALPKGQCSFFVRSSNYKRVRTSLLTHAVYTMAWLRCSRCIAFLQHKHRTGFQEEVQMYWLLCLLVTCTSVQWNDMEHPTSPLRCFPTTSSSMSPQHVIKGTKCHFWPKGYTCPLTGITSC